MAIIETKYKLGQAVYRSYCSNKSYLEVCPDCEGTGVWKIEGKERTTGCQTCNDGSWSWNTPGKVMKYKYFPIIQRLTIGQIQVTIGYGSGVKYMCDETGLGSGSLYEE